MTPEEKLAVLKIMVGSADAEYDSGLLSAYLSIAGSKIISRAYPYKTNITDVPPQYDLLQVEIAAYLINKRGNDKKTELDQKNKSRRRRRNQKTDQSGELIKKRTIKITDLHNDLYSIGINRAADFSRPVYFYS